MITELHKQDFYKIRHITDQCQNLEARAVVNGNNPGKVYADHPSEPTAALIWIQGQKGFQLVGDVQSQSFLNNLNGCIKIHIEPELQKQNIYVVEIGAEKTTWDQTIREMFANRNISSDIQHVFSTRVGESSQPLPTLFKNNQGMVRRLDRELLESKRLDNYSFVEKKIANFWDSTDAFLQNGFGYYVEHQNKAVSLCFSAFVADQQHAIDVETLEEYRQRNYGAAVAKAFIQECMQRGINPYWDCTPDNTGSIRLAQTVGLAHSFDYQIYWYDF